MANGKIRFGKQSGGQLSLVFPDGVTNTEVIVPESGILATKDYADLKVALVDFTETNVNLATNGYQKLPSGLIIQWGTYNYTNDPSTGFAVVFPIAFINSCLNVSVTKYDSFYSQGDRVLNSWTLTDFKFYDSSVNGDENGITWFAIGY